MASWATAGALNIGYKGTMFKHPECKYQVAHVIPEGDSPEETKLLVAAYQKLWNAGFAKLCKDREKAIKSAMEGTEKDIKKKPPANMDGFLSTANKLIQQGVDVWRNVQVVKLAQECMEKVYSAVEAKLKKKLVHKQVRTVLKIVALVLITLAVAAVSIAATVLTGGALAGVVVVAVGTGIGALITSAKTIKKGYDDYKGFLKKIEQDVEDLNKAIAYRKKKIDDASWRKLSVKEKLKNITSMTGGPAKNLRKHLADAEGRLILTRNAMNKAIVEANEAASKFEQLGTIDDKNISGEAKAAWVEMKKTQRALEKFTEVKNRFDQLKTEANKALAELEKNAEWDGGKVSKLVQFAEDHADTANFLFGALKTLATAAKKLQKAVGS